jgi:hypothetical protein
LELVRCSEQNVFAEYWTLELHADWQRDAIGVDCSARNGHTARSGNIGSHGVLVAEVHRNRIGM